MQFTKDQVTNQGWSITWDRPTKASPGVFYKILELAFEQCGALDRVGFGYKPTDVDRLLAEVGGNVSGFIQWVDWGLWATVPKDQHESFRQALFSSVPPNTEINCAVFLHESAADRFKELLEQRVAWLALGGERYW